MDFPAESPVPSASPDDIPPTNVDIVTYTGAIVKARANHNYAFIEMSPDDQRVWFGVDTFPGTPRVFYNRRVRDNASSPWRWLYSYSPAVIQHSQQASNIPGAVLYSATPKYYDSVSQRYYKYILYESFQPAACDGHVMGFLFYAFSDDGICWTPPRQATRTQGPVFPCYSGVDTVPIEQVTAIDGGDRIWLVGVEGDVIPLANAQNMSQTFTTLGYAVPRAPGTIHLNSTPTLSARGIFRPQTGPANNINPDRYRSYAYFMNLQMAYDAESGYLYIGRAYPYPFDSGRAYDPETETYHYDPPHYKNTPTFNQVADVFLQGPNGMSAVEGCAEAPATLPNRIQIYRMHIGSLANMGLITTGTWSLVTDLGGPLGYAFQSWPLGPTQQTPLVTRQVNAGRDYGALSFLRDPAGNLVRYGTTAYFFGADTVKLSKGGSAPCRITGMERTTLLQLP